MATFEIRGREYEFPTDFWLTDPVLVKAVTDLSFQEFLDALDTEDEEEVDPVVLAGLVAVGISHKFPTWGRGKVLRYVESLKAGEVKIIGNEGPPEADAEVPLSTDDSESPPSLEDSKDESVSV